MDEYVDGQQETGNLPDVEMVDIDDINCLPLLIMSYCIDCQFALINWMNTEQCIDWLSATFFILINWTFISLRKFDPMLFFPTWFNLALLV